MIFAFIIKKKKEKVFVGVNYFLVGANVLHIFLSILKDCIIRKNIFLRKLVKMNNCLKNLQDQKVEMNTIACVIFPDFLFLSFFHTAQCGKQGKFYVFNI
jgi:hypothetical protein